MIDWININTDGTPLVDGQFLVIKDENGICKFRLRYFINGRWGLLIEDMPMGRDKATIFEPDPKGITHYAIITPPTNKGE